MTVWVAGASVRLHDVARSLGSGWTRGGDHELRDVRLEDRQETAPNQPGVNPGVPLEQLKRLELLVPPISIANSLRAVPLPPGTTFAKSYESHIVNLFLLVKN
jgi:hypothetical protein